MKRLIDVITVLLLTASFGMAYYTGFVGKNASGDSMLATNLFAIMSMAGAAVLFAIGTFSMILMRAKMRQLTIGALIFAVIQFMCVVGICVITSMLWMGMFKLENGTLRILYLVFVAVLLVGYVNSLLFTDSLARRQQFEEEYDDYDDVDVLEPTASISPANRGED